MKTARLELDRRQLCALALALEQVQRRNDFGYSTRAELERARVLIWAALERACVPPGGEKVRRFARTLDGRDARAEACDSDQHDAAARHRAANPVRRACMRKGGR